MHTEFWKRRIVFVTGASGLLGSTLVRVLVDSGAEVVALVRDSFPRSWLWSSGVGQRITCVHGSITDFTLLRRVIAEYGVETVFHLAAQTLVDIAKLDPVGTLDTNIGGTWLLLEAARQSNVKQVVLASSDKAYGTSDNLPYREDHPLRGEYPYEVSKSCADLIARMYYITYGLPVSVARCVNLFGPGDLNFNRLIPGTIKAMLLRETLTIRSNGRSRREFLFVEDAASGYMCLAEEMSYDTRILGEAFNFGSGTCLEVLDVCSHIFNIGGCQEMKPQILNTSSTEIEEQSVDSSKARTTLNWSPAHTFEEGIRKSVRWYKEIWLPTA